MQVSNLPTTTGGGMTDSFHSCSRRRDSTVRRTSERAGSRKSCPSSARSRKKTSSGAARSPLCTSRSRTVADTRTPDSDVFRGIAVSPGLGTGPARVIHRATTDEIVRPGEILVAPFTDPGWTPYFVTAAGGIVMDMGGLLSHGSIVAREYGIPAVVNVGLATKMIETGQMIQVDGDRGEVRIVD